MMVAKATAQRQGICSAKDKELVVMPPPPRGPFCSRTEGPDRALGREEAPATTQELSTDPRTVELRKRSKNGQASRSSCSAALAVRSLPRPSCRDPVCARRRSLCSSFYAVLSTGQCQAVLSTGHAPGCHGYQLWSATHGQNRARWQGLPGQRGWTGWSDIPGGGWGAWRHAPGGPDSQKSACGLSPRSTSCPKCCGDRRLAKARDSLLRSTWARGWWLSVR